MDTVIIGIHGLRNKPPKYVLTGWWKRSIIEGFRHAGLRVPRIRFMMAYWAHYMHVRPQLQSVKDPEDPRYLPEPYVPGEDFGPREPKSLREKLSDGLHGQILQLISGKHGFMNIDAVSDIILHRMFVELDTYYHKKLRDGFGGRSPARDLIRGELAGLIEKHRKRQILVLAHSMGAIIAYDVLLHVVPDIPIHTFITMGAPLGFPVILRQIRHELGLGRSDTVPLPTPPSIQHHWLNFSDLDDSTCLNYDLHNHYRENSNGVRPHDQIVFNNYAYKGHSNHHKGYGYLRTPQVTDALHQFLCLENAGMWQRLKWVFRKPEF